MGEEVIIKSLRLCASEESRCVVCEYRHHKGCIVQMQRDAADALEQLDATNKTLMRLMRQQAAELERRDRLLKEQEAAIQTALDAAEEQRQEAAYASEFQCALAALRPITREQVEKMRGKWIDARYSSKDVPKCQCSICGKKYIGLETDFCQYCGAPMTDKAVDILWKRLEAMQDAQEHEI